MIQLGIRSWTKNPTPAPPKNLRLLATPAPQTCLQHKVL